MIKDKILSKSNQFNYYKDNYFRLLEENKKIKEDLKKIKKNHNKLKKNNARLKKQNDILEKDNIVKNNDFDLLKPYVLESSIENSDLKFCPVCGRPTEFVPAGITKRKNALCNKCKAFERHRLFFLVLLKKYNHIFNKNIKLLHFAPEKVLYNKFINNESVDYYPVDIDPENFAKKNMTIRDKVNMEEIPYEDNKFDLIINVHVLEHVHDDMKAMHEIYRVLKKGGICFVSVPLSGNYETLQKPEYNTPELRLKHYLQEDHVRLYGYDIKDKLESVGFEVKQYNIDSLTSEEKVRELYGLHNGFVLFVCEK